jgi:DNA-binding NarL/FixJ family response regulator
VPTIATELFISQSTVRNDLASIYTKFDVHSQAELLAVLRRPPAEVQPRLRASSPANTAQLTG